MSYPYHYRPELDPEEPNHLEQPPTEGFAQCPPFRGETRPRCICTGMYLKVDNDYWRGDLFRLRDTLIANCNPREVDPADVDLTIDRVVEIDTRNFHTGYFERQSKFVFHRDDAWLNEPMLAYLQPEYRKASS